MSAPVRVIEPLHESPQDPSAPARRRRFLAMLPWVVAALSLAAAATFGFLWRGAETAGADEAALRARARQFVLALTNFSARTIEDDVDDIRSYATGRFADEVDTLFDDDAIAAIEDAGASSRARVRELFVQSMSSERASVFAVVEEEVMNDSLTDPETGTIRLEIELVEEAGAWKVEAVQLFQSPGSPRSVSDSGKSVSAT